MRYVHLRLSTLNKYTCFGGLHFWCSKCVGELGRSRAWMVLWTRMYCRSLRHECTFAADPSVDKEREVFSNASVQALAVTPAV